MNDNKVTKPQVFHDDAEIKKIAKNFLPQIVKTNYSLETNNF